MHLPNVSCSSIEMPRAVIDAIFAHAEADAPVECCGLVLGTRYRPGACRATFARPARNLLDSPTRFQIDPEDHFAAIRQARQQGWTVVGAYHSHPRSPAIPSATDLAEATDTELLYLIVSLRDRDLRAYRLCDGNFVPVALVPLS